MFKVVLDGVHLAQALQLDKNLTQLQMDLSFDVLWKTPVSVVQKWEAKAVQGTKLEEPEKETEGEEEDEDEYEEEDEEEDSVPVSPPPKPQSLPPPPPPPPATFAPTNWDALLTDKSIDEFLSGAKTKK